jgi:secreted Zn-dependent insulinase-like peptidase
MAVMRIMRPRSMYTHQDTKHNLPLSSPLRYLSHLLGHESEGSILSLLRAKGWANGLSAGGQVMGRNLIITTTIIIIIIIIIISIIISIIAMLIS